MVFELMSTGTLAKLPREFIPEGILDLESNLETNSPFVMLLLPHNRYVLGQVVASEEHWLWGKPGGVTKDIFLYENEKLKLSQDEISIELSAEIVTFLKRELMRQMEPPGDHLSTVLLLRGLMRSHAAFADDFPFQDEGEFLQVLNCDDVLRKAYWTLRFAMTRGEIDIMTRIKAWLKAGPELFEESEHSMRLWFSIMNLPDDPVLNELKELSFSREDLNHMVSQKVSPLLLFNPRSGYLVLMKMTQQTQQQENSESSFQVWAYVPPKLWTELRERRKLSVREILLALWGQRDVSQAMEVRSCYAHPYLEKQEKQGGAVSLGQA